MRPVVGYPVLGPGPGDICRVVTDVLESTAGLAWKRREPGTKAEGTVLARAKGALFTGQGLQLVPV